MIRGVDYSFLTKKEGRCRYGYVPMRDGQILYKSGVTVGTGVDLGQMTGDQINRLDITEDLKKKLFPYAEKRREAALSFLKKHPLILTDCEVDELDEAIQERDFSYMIRIFEADSKVDFDSIPNQAKTVLCSLALNFGANLRIFRNTWRLAVAQNWKELAHFLHNFPSKQVHLKKRRQSEAALLRTIYN